MKINTIKIKNFRGIPDMEISLERISFFTGPCGAGKTSVLKAFNFALTGDVKKDDIREQSDRASATIVFEDQSSIQRICKLSAATQVKVNGKNSTAKAADEFLQAKLGTSTDIFQAMCKTDFFEVLSQKEQTEFFLSILPTKISFEKLCEFMRNQRIIAGNAQFTGIAAGRGVGFTTGLLLLRKGLGMRETPIRPHSWHCRMQSGYQYGGNRKRPPVWRRHRGSLRPRGRNLGGVEGMTGGCGSGCDPAIHTRRLRVYHRPRRLRMASRISIFFAARRFEPLNSMG